MRTKGFLVLLAIVPVLMGMNCDAGPVQSGLPQPGAVAVPPPPPDAPSTVGNMDGGGTLSAKYQHFQGYSAITATIEERTRLGREMLKIRLYRADGNLLLGEQEVQLSDEGDASAGFFIDKLGEYTVKVVNTAGEVTGTVTINVR